MGLCGHGMGLALAVLLASAVAEPSIPGPTPSEHGTGRPMQLALLCLLTGQQVSGQNKICYYNCVGSVAAITVKAYELCPPQIQRQ